MKIGKRTFFLRKIYTDNCTEKYGITNVILFIVSFEFTIHVKGWLWWKKHFCDILWINLSCHVSLHWHNSILNEKYDFSIFVSSNELTSTHNWHRIKTKSIFAIAKNHVISKLRNIRCESLHLLIWLMIAKNGYCKVQLRREVIIFHFHASCFSPSTFDNSL